LGIILAGIIGGAVYFYITIPAFKTMNKYRPFSSMDFKETAKKIHVKNKKNDER